MAARPPRLHQLSVLLLAVTLPPPQSATAEEAVPEATGLQCVPAGAATVSVPECYWRPPHAECYGFPPDAVSPGDVTLSLDVGGGNSPVDTRLTFCVTLARFQRKSDVTCLERLEFQNFVVGWAEFDPLCKERDCLIDVYILESVAALNPLRYNSASKEFWEFTSPVFREDAFLASIYFNKDYLIYKRCSISLANMYKLDKTSIETLVLFNNDNNSTNLKLGLMPKLVELTIANSSILHFPEDAHIMMPALEILNLRYNRLTSIPAAIAGMRKLKKLDMSGTRLRRLGAQLPPLPQLTELGLRDTELCCLHQEQDAFRGVPNLELLDISRNLLTSVGAALRGFHQLNYLDISHNQLTEYPELRIQRCREGLFSFDNNNLRTLPDCNTFCQRSNVLYLDVQHNKISSWDGSSDMLRCLLVLNLSNNTVSELSPTMLDTLDAVTEVDLRDNPLQCAGCALSQLQQWLVSTAVVVRAARDTPAGEALRCAGPANVAGMSVGAVPADPAACLPPPASAGLALGLSLAAAAVCAAALATGCYRYRFEVAYGAHPLRMRRHARLSRRRGKDDANSNFLFDAFILYSGSDRSWVVGTLVPLLENGPQRYRLCLHERDFQLGTVIVQNISTSMDRSRHTIVVLSKSFLSSRWCLWEMDLASHRTLDPSQREFIILLELEPLERSALPRHLRFLMDTRTYLEWHQAGDAQYEEQAFRKLKRALGPSCFACSDSGRC